MFPKKIKFVSHPKIQETAVERRSGRSHPLPEKMKSLTGFRESLQNLKDIKEEKILKTKMYSFNEVREMFELERIRIKEEIMKIKLKYYTHKTANFGGAFLFGLDEALKEILVILEEKK